MLKCTKNEVEIQIDSSDVLRTLLENETLSRTDLVLDVESNSTVLLKDTEWYKLISTGADPHKSKGSHSVTKNIFAGLLLLAGLGMVYLKSSHDFRMQTTTIDAYSGSAAQGYFAGSAFVLMLFTGIIYSIGSFIAKTRKKKAPSLLFAGVVFFTLALITLSSSISQQAKQEQLENTLVEMMQTASTGSVPKAITFDEETYGENALIGTVIQDFLINAKSLNNKLAEKINQAQLQKILSKETLSDANKISAAEDTIKDIMVAIDQYEKDTNTELNQLRKQIESADLPSDLKKGFISGYLDAIKTNKIDLDQFFLINKKTYGITLDTLKFMASRHGKFTFSDGQLLFDSDDDVKIYNSFIDKIQALAAEEEALQKRMQSRKAKSISDFENTNDGMNSQ